MNATQKRTLQLLLIAVAALLAILICVKLYQNHAAQEAEAAQAVGQASIITDSTSAYKALSYFNGAATLSFAIGEDGAWQWVDDTSFPVDETYISAVTDALSTLTPQQTITEGDTLESYGLDEPSQTLTATAENGMITTIALGNTTTDGNSYYMLMNDAQTPVYIISDALAKAMSVSIYDMMALPALPELAEDQLQSITLAGQVQTVLTASHQAPENEDGPTVTSWQAGRSDVTEDPQVSGTGGIVNQVLGLAVDSCVDYRPSDAAASLCGFDDPDAVITVTYSTAAGATGTLTLSVGTQVLDGNGRYVRINDDETIYRMTADKLDMLMKVSVNGLENYPETATAVPVAVPEAGE